jgi:hypothetical protein
LRRSAHGEAGNAVVVGWLEGGGLNSLNETAGADQDRISIRDDNSSEDSTRRRTRTAYRFQSQMPPPDRHGQVWMRVSIAWAFIGLR